MEEYLTFLIDAKQKAKTELERLESKKDYLADGKEKEMQAMDNQRKTDLTLHIHFIEESFNKFIKCFKFEIKD